MMLPVSMPGRCLILVGLVVMTLTACGRRGPLEPPPDPAAIAAQRQREELRRQRGQGRAGVAQTGAEVTTGGATAGQTRIPPLAQANRTEGEPAPDADEDELPSIVPSPAPTPRSSASRKRGYVVPKEPFVLDPLL
jgi:predicted small lipoprotein YifL